jgi:hypothetical protein
MMPAISTPIPTTPKPVVPDGREVGRIAVRDLLL